MTATAIAAEKNKFANKEKRERNKNMDNEKVDGYSVPMDPMDLLQCDSCQ